MPAVVTEAVAFLNVAVYAEAVVIVALLVLVGVLYVHVRFAESDLYEVVAERDTLRVTLATMREMSRTHAETVTRLASVVGKKNRKGGS
jgi:hypothetical protein